MQKVLTSERFQLGAVGVLMVVLGVVVASVLNVTVFRPDSVGDRLLVTTSGIEAALGSTGFGIGEVTVKQLPRTAAEAVAAGWKDSFLCSAGRGRYFEKDQPEPGDPAFIMYDKKDDLIGFYLYSLTAIPSPPGKWLDELQGPGRDVIEFEHWGLFVYTKNPYQACVRDVDRSAGQLGRTEGGAGRVRSTPTPYVPPTPTPTPNDFLSAAAKRMGSLASFSFTLTTEQEDTPLMAGLDVLKVEGTVSLPGQVSLTVTDAAGSSLQAPAASLPFKFVNLAATLGDIALALQDPVDATRQWIDNLPHRGLSGTVLGQQLSALIPSADPGATVKLTLWLAEDGLIRRVRIEGPVAPNDPPEAVRILSLSDLKSR